MADAAARLAAQGLVMTYPHYLYLRDQLVPDVSIYYNIDDYRPVLARVRPTGSVSWSGRWCARRT